MGKTLGLGGSHEFIRWATAQGWRPLFRRHCTHEFHQNKRHFYSKMKGYRLYQRDWRSPHVDSLSSQGIYLNPEEQICEADLVAEWNRQKRGEIYPGIHAS
jgi:hypothetical protein